MISLFGKTLPRDIALQSIFLALAINNFAKGLVSVFVPLIILASGGTFSSVALFYLIYASAKFVINYFAMKSIQHSGASNGLFIGFFAGAVHLILITLYAKTSMFSLLMLAAVGLSIANAFCWNAMHLYFSSVLNQATTSGTMAKFDIVNKVLAATAPIVGASIAIYFGGITLLGISTSLTFLTLLPLRAMRRFEREYPIAKVPLRFSLIGAPLRDVAANFCFNIEAATGWMLWPIFLAVVLGNYQSIGIIESIGLVIALAMVRIAGHLGDRGRNSSVLVQGSICCAIAHLLRLVVLSPIAIGVLESWYQCSAGYRDNAWTSRYYNNAAKQGINYIVSMEIACDVAYVFLTLFFLWLIHTTSVLVTFHAVFILAACASFGTLLMKKAE